MKNNRILLVIKFGAKEHIESLLNEGEIHFGPLWDFSQSVEKERGDPYEGATNLENIQLAKIEVEHPVFGNFQFTPTSKKSRITEFNDQNYKVFSCYMITKKNLENSNNHYIVEPQKGKKVA